MTPATEKTTLNARNRRALVVLLIALVAAAIVRFGLPDQPVEGRATIAPGDSTAGRQRLERLRQIAGTLPAREATMKQVAADLAARERGVIQAATIAQAQATLLETANRLGKAESLDVRGGDFPSPRAFGEYGLVYATFTFECRIEQLVNFLTDLEREPQLVAPLEERISQTNAKEKTMTVRMVLAGVVPRKLIPEKKAGGF